MRACLFLFLLFISIIVVGQSVSPVVPDFTDITAPWVEATTGYYDNPFQKPGVVAGRHTVITVQGTDPNTDNKLSLLPPGESRVVRLGNSQTGAEAESISYRFIVDMEKSVLLLKFAVVMEDPMHEQPAQPRFVVRILNKDGELVESCSEYDVFASPEIDGFQTYERTFYQRIQWRDWTPVGLDLSALAGQEVQVQFITYDCAHYGHFGYAYFTAECVSNRLQIAGCMEPEVSLEAPSGFASYTWQDGSIDPARSVATGTEDISMACEVVSATGCRFTLSAFISSAPDLPIRDTVLYDTICEGDEYHRNYYSLSARDNPGTGVYYNTFFNPATCSGDVTSTLFLTVMRRYTRLEAQICQGEDYLENGFRILQPKPGIYEEKWTVPSENGCERVTELKLVVASSPEHLSGINGSSIACAGTVATYEVPDVVGVGNYRWTVPENAYIFAGQGTGTIRVQFTDAASSGAIKFTAANGCGSDSLTLPVTVHPSYHELYTDSVCAGSAYSGYGFEVSSLPNETFRRTVTQPYKTLSGCDSIRFLDLTVFNTPVVEILSQDTIVCSGDPISLAAYLKEGAGGVPVRRIHIGDVVCTDGSIFFPEEFLAVGRPAGKEAKGVVFYVGKGGQSGTMVGLYKTTGITFGPAGTDYESVIGVPYSTQEESLNDLDGYDHTLQLYIHVPGSGYAYSMVGFPAGWYIPALGELRQLLAVHQQVNATLKLLNVDSLGVLTDGYYWSSTPRNSGEMWMVQPLLGGYYVPGSVTLTQTLRPVAPFPAVSMNCVIINGVCWATCNVDAPGTFAASPEDTGMFYQWNRRKGWPATGTATGWDSSYPSSSWDPSNDPCPVGWRVPTDSDYSSLRDMAKVTPNWTQQNGVDGMGFTDNSSGQSVFFPAAGSLGIDSGLFSEAGTNGYYWSNTISQPIAADYLSFFASFPGRAYRGSADFRFGFPVRCVRE